MFDFKIYDHSESVVYHTSEGREHKMKGLDITLPPALPKHFAIKKGCREHVYLGGDIEDEPNDPLNTGMMGEGDNHWISEKWKKML